MDKINPFSHIRASEYTDDEINSLWVGFGPSAITAVIEPRSKVSKYILGGKGSGKTHVLRYHSYHVARRRFQSGSGLSVLVEQKFLAVFLRAAAFDASRFETISEQKGTWQQIFGVYLELRLVEEIVEALYDVRQSSTEDKFDDVAFIRTMAKVTSNETILNCLSLSDFLQWVVDHRRSIDEAVNHWAFTGELPITIPFNLGSAAFNISYAIAAWHPSLASLPLIYLIDEIENFSEAQQEVVNTFIRYGGGQATFRVTGRLYSIKTYATINSGEENREDAEFKVTILDDILRQYRGYSGFAKKFITNHLISSADSLEQTFLKKANFDPRACFEEVKTENFYSAPILELGLSGAHDYFLRNFIGAITMQRNSVIAVESPAEIARVLTDGFPVLLQKLNLLLFCKKFSRKTNPSVCAQKIAFDCNAFLENRDSQEKYYAIAYGHYSGDLFAQLCKESRNSGKLPYAGFETFVRMSAGNPRNLLIILGRAFDIASFREIDFINGRSLPIALQTEAALASAIVAYDKDPGYGPMAESAKAATNRFASVLRAARYALRIPEVSPLAVSFLEDDLSNESRKVLQFAIHYSFVFEIKKGRRDRNTQRLNRKIQLNPMMAPSWGLPLGRRGDLKLNKDLLNAIFDPVAGQLFDQALKDLERKWNKPFKLRSSKVPQKELF